MSWRGWTAVGCGVALLAAVGFAVHLWIQGTPHQQILTLPNGQPCRFAGVTYGTNHAMGSRLYLLVQKLPGPLKTLAVRVAGSRLGTPRTRRSSEPSLAVWFETLPTPAAPLTGAANLRAALADENGIVSGEQDYVSVPGGTPSPTWIMSEFAVLPRRSRTLECVLFQYTYGSPDRYTELGRFRFRNPAYGQHPQWKPESVPATKPAGDITVTLHQFVSGIDSGGGEYSRRDGVRYDRYRAAAPGKEPQAAVRFTVDSTRGTNESWTVHDFFLADATGNDRRATSWSHSVGRPAHFSPVLWPGDQAWKLTARFKRKEGVPAGDRLVFRDVPLPEVGATNLLDLTNTLHGLEFVLESIIVRTPMTNQSYSSRDLSQIRVAHPDLPDDYAVDLLEVGFEDPTLTVQPGGSSYGDSYHESQFTRFPTNQPHATIIYAVQKLREVEFLVPPNRVDSTNTVEIRMDDG